MQPTFLGKVTVPSAGTPVPLASDPALRACAVLVTTIPGLTGNVYLGGAEINQATLQGVMIQFNAPAALGPADQFLLATKNARNSIRLSDYYLDVSVSGEGALVTYFQT